MGEDGGVSFRQQFQGSVKICLLTGEKKKPKNHHRCFATCVLQRGDLLGSLNGELLQLKSP